MGWHRQCNCVPCAVERRSSAQRLQELTELASKAYETISAADRIALSRPAKIEYVAGLLVAGGIGAEQAEALAKTAVRQAEKGLR